MAEIKEENNILNNVDEGSIIGVEYIGGEYRVKNVGKTPHTEIISNIGTAVSSHVYINKKQCRTYQDSLFVKSEMTREEIIPDIIIICDGMEIKDLTEGKNKGKASTNDALLIIEVLSSSTYEKDLTDKYDSYCRLPSLIELVYIWSDRIRVEVNTRTEGSGWIKDVYNNRKDYFKLTSIDLEVNISEIYDRVEFEK